MWHSESLGSAAGDVRRPAHDVTMTVQCPRCQTQYRVPESRLEGAQPVFKCTRCDLVFKSEPGKGARTPRRAKAGDSNLSFDFPRGGGPKPAPTPETGPDEEAENDEPAFVSRLESGKRAKATDPGDDVPDDEEEEDLEFDDDEPIDEEEFDDDPIEEEEEQDDDPPPPVIVAPRQKPASIRPRAKAAPKRRSPLKPITVCVGLIVGFYLLVVAALERNPAEALQQLSEVPVLGGLLGQDHLLVWRLEVTNLEGGLDYIGDHKLAYVVSGRAVNTTSRDLRIVEVEGGLVVGGKQTRRQRVYAANQARSTIRDLSASEVEMLLRLEPNRRFRIRPGESASFLLVFPDPPSGFDEIVVRVVDARVA